MTCRISTDCDGSAHESDALGEWHRFGPHSRVLVSEEPTTTPVDNSDLIETELIEAEMRRAAASRLGLRDRALEHQEKIAALRGQSRKESS